MSGSAIVMMILGMVILWGGMAASITYAYIVSKRRKRQTSLCDEDSACLALSFWFFVVNKERLFGQTRPISRLLVTFSVRLYNRRKHLAEVSLCLQKKKETKRKNG